jgi:hypothetical protein
MPKGPFLASEFVPTKFSSAADKADFGNALLNFLDADCTQELFTKKLYQRLSMTFGHIAHYVELEIMRSTSVKTAWIQRSNTRPLCIITPFELSASAKFRLARHPGVMSRRTHCFLLRHGCHVRFWFS